MFQQNNKCFYATHAKALSYLILLIFCLLVVNIYLGSLKINIVLLSWLQSALTHVLVYVIIQLQSVLALPVS